MISSHIEDIITALKAKPNSLRRNKAVSHAEDLLAHVLLMEMEELPSDNSKGLKTPQNASNDPALSMKAAAEGFSRFAEAARNEGCTCPAGTRSNTCLVHGGFKG